MLFRQGLAERKMGYKTVEGETSKRYHVGAEDGVSTSDLYRSPQKGS